MFEFKAVDRSRLARVFGIVFAVLAMALVVCALVLMYRHRDKAGEILISIVGREAKWLVSATGDVWDVVGDVNTFSTFLAVSSESGSKSERLRRLVVPYWVCVGLALLISTVVLVVRLYIGYGMWKRRR